MKKTTSLLLAVTILLSVSVISLFGCGLLNGIKFDEVKKNLETAGYEVVVMSGTEFVESQGEDYPFIMEHELEKCLYAVKGDEKLYLFVFISIDAASRNSDTIYSSSLQQGQINEVVYLTTKQAKKDAKF